MKNGILYIVCGATGSGKSTLSNSIIANKKLNFTKAPKYSTREYRGEGDDIIPIKDMDIGEYDFAYVAMDNKYGLKFNEIEKQLNAGKNSILVLTDFRAVQRLKSIFSENATAICVSSAIDPNKFLQIHGKRYDFLPSKAKKRLMQIQFSRLSSSARLDSWSNVYECTRELLELWQQSIPEHASLEIRTRKVRDFQTKYIENMNLFDHLILNYREGHPEDMSRQFINIFNSHKYNHLRRRPQKGPVLFVVAAASGAGKGLMTENLRIIAPNEVAVVKKEGKRNPRKKDSRDGMKAIGTNGKFTEGFDIRYQLHKLGDFKGTWYAFSEKEIRDNFKLGKNQVVIANVLLKKELLSRLRSLFQNQLVVVYLLRFIEEKKLAQFQYDRCETKAEAEARINEMSAVYESYINNISEVDYVLLNTAYPEDLYDQMFKLIEYYGVS